MSTNRTKANPVSLPKERVRATINNRLQQVNAHLKIWMAFEMQDYRPPHYAAFHNYGEFVVWLPNAMITSFILNLCSLFDRGSDCVTMFTYRDQISLTSTIPIDVSGLIDETDRLVKPLRKARDAYHAHRLSDGMTADIINENGLTCNRLIEMDEQTTRCFEALLSIDGGLTFTRHNPIGHITQMASDLACCQRP